MFWWKLFILVNKKLWKPFQYIKIVIIFILKITDQFRFGFINLVLYQPDQPPTGSIIVWAMFRGNLIKVMVWLEFSLIRLRLLTSSISRYYYLKCQKLEFGGVVDSVLPKSILGPVLFLIYINSLKSMHRSSKLCQFADNTTCVVASTEIDILASSVNTVVGSITEWCTLTGRCWIHTWKELWNLLLFLPRASALTCFICRVQFERYCHCKLSPSVLFCICEITSAWRFGVLAYCICREWYVSYTEKHYSTYDGCCFLEILPLAIQTTVHIAALIIVEY